MTITREDILNWPGPRGRSIPDSDDEPVAYVRRTLPVASRLAPPPVPIRYSAFDTGRAAFHVTYTLREFLTTPWFGFRGPDHVAPEAPLATKQGPTRMSVPVHPVVSSRRRIPATYGKQVQDHGEPWLPRVGGE